jgi:hypothetical protein
VRGRDLDQRRHPLGVGERERHRGRGPHRAAREQRPVDRELVEHVLEVRDQVGVLVVGRGRGRVGLAVPARVVGHQPVSAAGEVARALEDVAARRRQPVQQDQRQAVAVDLAAQHDLAVRDRTGDLERCRPGIDHARPRTR